MKRIVCIVLTLIIVLAVTAGAAAQSNVNRTALTVEEAQKLAKANSRQTIIDDLDIKAKEIALEQAKVDARLAGYRYGSENITANRIKMDVNVFESEVRLEEAKRAKEDNTKRLKLDVNSSFLNILLTQMELEIETKKLEFAKERLEMAQARYAAKMIRQDELDSAKYNVDSKENVVKGVQSRLQTLDMELKSQLNVPLGGDMLTVKGVIEQDSFPELNIDAVVAINADLDASVFSAEKKYEAAQKTMELTEKLLRTGSPYYESNKISLEAAFRDYEAAVRNREVNIRNAYNDLMNFRDSAALAAKREEIMRKKADNEKIKFEKGQITRDSYLSSEEEYLDALFGKYKAIVEFNINRGEFLNKINKD